MDTQSELARDATAIRHTVQYGCSVSPCDAALVNDFDDLNPCEKCSLRVCDGHFRKRESYGLCSTCDASERGALVVLVADELTDIAGKITARLLTAEDVLFKLSDMALRVSEIEEATS